MCLVLKDSIEKLNPKFRINVLAVAEAVLEMRIHRSLEYAMWAKMPTLPLIPTFTCKLSASQTSEWNPVHGFANGYKDDKVAELIDAAAVELDTAKRAALYKS